MILVSIESLLRPPGTKTISALTLPLRSIIDSGEHRRESIARAASRGHFGSRSAGEGVLGVLDRRHRGEPSGALDEPA